MSWESIWRWMLWPVLTIDRTMLAGDPTIQASSWQHLVVLAVLSFFILGAAILLLAVATYALLRWLDNASEGVLRWSCLGASLETVQRTASRYVALSAFWRYCRQLLPISTGAAEPHSPGLPFRRALPVRASQVLIRWSASLPHVIAAVAYLTVRATRAPLGAYALVASTWVVFHPAMSSARSVATSLWHWAGRSDSLAAISLAAALAAVLLDHGLSTRVRARNSWRRASGERAESGLAELAEAAACLADAIGSSTEDLIHVVPRHLRDAVASGSRDLLSAWDGTVERRVFNPADRSSRRLFGPQHRDWNAEAPLLYERDPWNSEQWTPEAHVNTALDELNSVLAKYEHDPLSTQAPRSTRYFITMARFKWLGMDLGGLRRSRWESLGRELYQGMARAVESAEEAVQRCDRDHMDHRGGLHGPEVPPGFPNLKRTLANINLKHCQELLDSATTRTHATIWEAAVISASAATFSARINSWQSPQSLLARAISRFGG